MDKELKELEGLEWFLELLKQYLRPIVALAFFVVILILLYNCVTGTIDCNNSVLIEKILYLMSGYLGIYASGRSYEKAKALNNKKEIPKQKYIEK